MNDRLYTVTGADVFSTARRWLYDLGVAWYLAAAFAGYACQQGATVDSDFSRLKTAFDYDPTARTFLDFYGNQPVTFCANPYTCTCWRHYHAPEDNDSD